VAEGWVDEVIIARYLDRQRKEEEESGNQDSRKDQRLEAAEILSRQEKGDGQENYFKN
jgi:hypothetical protein